MVAHDALTIRLLHSMTGMDRPSVCFLEHQPLKRLFLLSVLQTVVSQTPMGSKYYAGDAHVIHIRVPLAAFWLKTRDKEHFQLSPRTL